MFAEQLLLLAPGLTEQKRSAGKMPALPYAPRLKRNRYSNSRTIAPMTDVIQLRLSVLAKLAEPED